MGSAIIDIAQKGSQNPALSALHEGLGSANFEGTSADGLVKVTYTGHLEPTEIEISEDLIAEGLDAVQVAVSQAMLSGYQRWSQAVASQMMDLYAEPEQGKTASSHAIQGSRYEGEPLDFDKYDTLIDELE